LSLWTKLARHQVGSLVATGVDFGVMIALVELARLSPVTATALGAGSGAIINFLLGHTWIFRDAGGRIYFQAIRYAVVAAGSLGLNSAGEYILHGVFEVPYVAARVAVAATVGIAWNFPLHRFFVFRPASVVKE
jgi:putative flippase GtrA